MVERRHLAVFVGACMVLAGAGLAYAGQPAYATTVSGEVGATETQENATTSTVPQDVEPIPYETLSESEQLAVDRARQSPTNRYTDGGRSDRGPTFDYRNDVTNRYVVVHDDRLYAVAVVIAMSPPALAVGGFLAVLGTGLLVVGAWRAYRA